MHIPDPSVRSATEIWEKLLRTNGCYLMKILISLIVDLERREDKSFDALDCTLRMNGVKIIGWGDENPFSYNLYS